MGVWSRKSCNLDHDGTVPVQQLPAEAATTGTVVMRRPPTTVVWPLLLLLKPLRAVLGQQTARHLSSSAVESVQQRLSTPPLSLDPRRTPREIISRKTKMPSNCSELPVWDLEAAFAWKTWDDPQLKVLVEDWEDKCKAFRADFEGQLRTKLEASVKELEKLVELEMKLSSYIRLSSDTDQENDALTQLRSNLSTSFARIRADHLTFYNIELATLSEEAVRLQMTPSLAFYKPFIDDVRKYRKHLLTQEVERALTLRAPWASVEPVVEYYLKRLSTVEFDCFGQKLTMEQSGRWDSRSRFLSQLLSKLLSPEAETRRTALRCLNEGLGTSKCNQFASLSLNLVSGAWHVENQERKYSSLRSRRNIANDIPDEVVESLLGAVRTKGVEIAKRYYRLKKNILQKAQGLENFTWADRNAPLPLSVGEKKYAWSEAVEIVGKGFASFSPVFHELFTKHIEENRLHVPPQRGKSPGAYCDAVFPGVGPFQLHNYMGTPGDVATLAHESGHAVHFALAFKQGPLMFSPPLTLAETASIFGEMIVFRDLLSRCESDEERLSMLMQKLDSIINSVVRQVAFDAFEQAVHSARPKGIIAEADFDKMWMQVTKEFYGEEGEVFDKYEDMDRLWSYVSHFHGVPFYVYSYAFADLVVGALYAAYTKCTSNFESNLIALLQAGGTKSFVDVLEPFGLRPHDPSFWEESLSMHLEALLLQAEEIATRMFQ